MTLAPEKERKQHRFEQKAQFEAVSELVSPRLRGRPASAAAVSVFLCGRRFDPVSGCCFALSARISALIAPLSFPSMSLAIQVSFFIIIVILFLLFLAGARYKRAWLFLSRGWLLFWLSSLSSFHLASFYITFAPTNVACSFFFFFSLSLPFLCLVCLSDKVELRGRQVTTARPVFPDWTEQPRVKPAIERKRKKADVGGE